jgi:hypothetical protein
MAIPARVRDEAVRLIDLFCGSRSSDEIRLEHAIRGGAITLVERRPPWSEPAGADWTSMKVAQLRSDERSRTSAARNVMPAPRPQTCRRCSRTGRAR